jgi:signal transduction histidine kinase
MQRSAQRITASNLSERLPVPPGNDEIAQLARLLNSLFGRLEAAFEQTKRFTADASHELRTPLSLIRLYAERLAASRNLGSSEIAQVEQQIEEIGRLNRLVDDLLMLARADAGNLGLRKKVTDIWPYLEDFGEDADALAEEKGQHFVLHNDGSGPVEFDPILLRQALLNLLTNALRHSPEGSQIELTSSVAGGRWAITLEDEGPGIPPDKLPYIFGRFVRFDSTTGEQTGGSGLGLAITKGIIEAHGGSIRIENRAPRGLRAALSLPAADPSASRDRSRMLSRSD